MNFATTPWSFQSLGPYDPEFRALNTGYPRFKAVANFSQPCGGRYWCYFPLWYPAIIFALAGVAVLRLSRQFSIRSALITTTVLATLIGMTVIL